MCCADDAVNEQSDWSAADSKNTAGVWETEHEDGDDWRYELVQCFTTSLCLYCYQCAVLQRPLVI